MSRVQWVQGDAERLPEVVEGPFDLVLTSPPYFDLEVYSAEDASALPTYEAFMAVMAKALAHCADLLVDGGVCVWKVGDVRDKAGHYRGFTADMVQAGRDAGLHLLNHAVLVTPVGSLPLRAGAAMRATRKLGKAHQDVLVWVKGGVDAMRDRLGELPDGAVLDVEGGPGGEAAAG